MVLRAQRRKTATTTRCKLKDDSDVMLVAREDRIADLRRAKVMRNGMFSRRINRDRLEDVPERMITCYNRDTVSGEIDFRKTESCL